MKYAPTLVTLTGASDDTNIDSLLEMSEKFPFVEWAILYSHDRSGKDPRYPSLEWIHKFLDRVATKPETNIAFHLCGSAVTDFILRYPRAELFFLAHEAAYQNTRIQLNFALNKSKFMIHQLQEAIDSELIPIITQHNEANKELLDYPFSDNHQILFDASGGQGIEVTKWPTAIPEKVCGYAGGIGPDNIGPVSFEIDHVAPPVYWIDMETKIRTDNKLDLELCLFVLRVCEGWIDMNKG